MSVIRIPNREFRRALLTLNGLAAFPAVDPLPAPVNRSGPAWVRDMVRRLGFVQVDSVSAVERAQHHILFSRSSRYRRQELARLLECDRELFENWTHDAAILPVELYPYWKHYFERAKNFEVHPGYRRYFAVVTPRDTAGVMRRIESDGPLRPRDLNSRKARFNDDFFASPSIAKIAMELLWRTGKLAVARREGRQKVYDLARRVIPAEHFEKRVSRSRYVDWACRESLKRLGAGTPTQVARFFDAVSKEEAAAWCRRNRDVVEAQVTLADGSTRNSVFALASLAEAIPEMSSVPRALRLLNPFDPLIHDRQRTRRVFGFDYTVEIWVPASKRRYGYYVLPILEGERFTGRLDAKVNRKRDELTVRGVWWEPGVKLTKRRTQQLDRALCELASFAGVSGVTMETS